MNQGKYIFAQLTDFLARRVFDRIVAKHDGNRLKADRRIYEILQILSISLLDKTPIKEILTKYDYKDVKELNNNQLIISGF